MKKLLFTLSILTIGVSNAAVVYSDIADATLTTGGSVEIDFNGGGADFTIEDVSFGATIEPGLQFNPDAGFVMLGDLGSGGWDEIIGLALNTSISATSNFANNGADGYIDPMWATTPFATGDTYIGATFKIGANVHYGWILVNWDGAGTLIVKSYAYNDAADTAILAGDTGATTSVAVTSVTVTGQGGATSVIKNSTLQMSTSVLPANATDMTVTWTVINGTGAATINASGLLSATVVGTVTVKATANDGSGIFDELEVDVTEFNGIASNTNLNVNIYPNPFNNEVYINAPIQSNIKIVDIAGKVVFEFISTSEMNEINLNHLNSGVYFVKISHNDNTVINKIIKK